MNHMAPARGVEHFVAKEIADEFALHGLGPYLATPCGVLAPLLGHLGSSLTTVSREETAVGVAAGAALAGETPVVLMQNSGFGTSVNALASLVQPYRIPILFVISLRGTAPDNTSENLLMGRLTEPVLELLDIPHRTLESGLLGACVEWAAGLVSTQRRAAALLVPPSLFGWSPA